jgi:endoglucanase
LNIPESGNAVPDMLDEIKWNLKWMLSMQDTDGGCWHKQTSEGWPGYIAPENDPFVNYVIGTGKSKNKGTCATAGLAAVGAIASRVFRPYDPVYADQCLNAAKKAFSWAVANPMETFTANPPPVQSGMYDDSDCSDELFWASAELARTTELPEYENYFRQNKNKFRAGQTPSWQNVGSFGLFTYALRNLQNQDSYDVRGSLVFRGDELLKRISSANYRHSLQSNEYIWGSNGVLLNQAIELLIAHKISPKKEYINAVMENLHYAFGRNSFSISFVSRVGTNYVRNFHFRQDIADGIADPWPGYISGGPNKDRQDPPSLALPQGIPPARLWLDTIESYATNEIAINWNSPFVFVVAGVLDAYKASGPSTTAGPSIPTPPATRPTPPPERPTPPPSERPTLPPSERPTPPPSRPTRPPSERPTPTPSGAQPGSCVRRFEQCSGRNYLGPSTCCEAGWTCKHYSEWYGQCAPA